MEEKIRILIEGDHMEKMPFIFGVMIWEGMFIM